MIYFLKNIKSILMKNANFDFIVIGTGMGGGTFGFALAKEDSKSFLLKKGIIIQTIKR